MVIIGGDETYGHYRQGKTCGHYRQGETCGHYMHGETCGHYRQGKTCGHYRQGKTCGHYRQGRDLGCAVELCQCSQKAVLRIDKKFCRVRIITLLKRDDTEYSFSSHIKIEIRRLVFSLVTIKCLCSMEAL